MYKILVFLSVFVVGAVSNPLESEQYFFERVYDYDLYENVLDPEVCRQQLQNMRTFEFKKIISRKNEYISWMTDEELSEYIRKHGDLNEIRRQYPDDPLISEFYDASFRVPQGISKGNFMSPGSFHQCLGIRQDVEDEVIEGKYCMINIDVQDTTALPRLSRISWDDVNWDEIEMTSTMNVMNVFKNVTSFKHYTGQGIRIDGIPVLDVSISLALCIPRTCSVNDVLGPFMNDTVNFEYEEEFCRLPGDKPLVAADYTAIVIFSIIGLLTLLSTAYDVRHRFLLRKDPSEASELLRCCSVYTNTKVLMTFGKSPPAAIDCIDGIRSLAITWIVIGHTFLIIVSRYTSNILDFFEWFDQRRAIWLRSATLNVDTFFILSGLLLVYTYARKMKQMQLLKNLHVFYLNRLLRMFPLLACAVLLQASLFNQVSDGANWHIMAEQVESCRKYWWTALLHIQNIVNVEEYCIPQSWYLSVDVQLHILSPLLLFWVLGSRRSAWNGLIIGFVAILSASTIYCFMKDFSLSSDNQVYFYRNTLTRSPPFVVGMIFGYFIHVYRGQKIKLSNWWVSFGYIAAFVVASYCFYVSYADWDSDVVDNLNRSFMRSLWGICVCWIIFVCIHGYGGPINWFLSLKIWKVFARISYAMYLFHYPILFAVAGSTVTSFYFSLESMTMMCASVLLYTVVVSVAACVLIDAPFAILQKRLLKALMPSPPPKTTSRSPLAATSKETIHDNPS